MFSIVVESNSWHVRLIISSSETLTELSDETIGSMIKLYIQI